VNLAARAVIGGVRLYQAAVSPRRGPSCRFGPTCSAYAVEAIESFGIGRGTWLALRRLSRCHPFHAGGYDPVPVGSGRPTAFPESEGGT
jgi:putative membrane protein insertion efficiency factor